MYQKALLNLCWIICITLSLTIDATGQRLKGKVLDLATNEPLIGSSIIIKGTTNGTTTDFEGSFSLKVPGFPVTIEVSYIGYASLEIEVKEVNENMEIKMDESVVVTEIVEVRGQRVSDKQKSAPLTVESMDLLAIRETPSDNFYDGLGTLKGVDLTAASLGFKIINTRGFNSTSPVRSLQLIDGVDNQAPGLNFSLGNFLGSSELDILNVDLIVGASSAFYGPNAFNGVISMTTKDPFFHKGFSAMVKGGERSLVDAAIRWADAVKNKNGKDVFGVKLNLAYMRADDWVADNFDPVTGTNTDETNPGRFDAVNIYGDEYNTAYDLSTAQPWRFIGLGQWHRTGYREEDLVNYDTRNYKGNVSFHLKTKPNDEHNSPELIFANSYSNGTTVYQGDNRFSLGDISFFQTRLEYRKKDNYFIRAYYTFDDAGKTYDPYFTALKLQQSAKTTAEWANDYISFWRKNYENEAFELGFPKLTAEIGPDGTIITSFDFEGAEQWLDENNGLLKQWHQTTEAHANKENPNSFISNQSFLVPGTPEFEAEFKRITSSKSNEEEGGTQFFDRSALYHLAGEYKFEPKFVDVLTVGGNFRRYTPNSKGTIFDDEFQTITNNEFGLYTGFDKKFGNEKYTFSATLRVDKNENFDVLLSPATSLVFKPGANNYVRFSFSSAIRNPTLTDQYLNLNVGPAILRGNLDGVKNLISLESFDDYRQQLDIGALQYFDIDPIQPEKVKTFELGYRSTLFNKLYADLSYYYSVYNDFLGFNIGIEGEFDQTSGFPTRLQAFRYSANSINKVTTQGFAIGLNYYFADFFMVHGNYSWNKLNKDFEDDPIIPAFNTPEHKYNLGISGRNIVSRSGVFSNFGFSVNYKWIDSFVFEGSPQFTGDIPSYDLLDAQINFYLERMDLTLKLGASNLLDNKVFQAYGGPRIGRLAYLSFLYEFKKK